MLVRKKGIVAAQWFFTLGCIHSGLAALAWPANCIHGSARGSSAASSSNTSGSEEVAGTYFEAVANIEKIHWIVATSL
eukprot:8324601-Lingulodinium_polyedra.AAC.1